MGTLRNTPRQQTVLALEQRKSFALGVKLVRKADGAPVDLTGAKLRLVIARPPHLGGTVVVNMLADLLDATGGYAQFPLQASQLDQVAEEYPFSITLLSRHNYSTVVAKGVVDLQENTETDSKTAAYPAATPVVNLVSYLADGACVKVEVDHVSVMPDVALADAAMTTVDADAGSAFRRQQDARVDAGYVPRGSLLVNVRDYGAKGNGVADDTAAFQNAKGGYVPAGDYIVNTDTVSLENFRGPGTVHKAGEVGRMLGDGNNIYKRRVVLSLPFRFPNYSAVRDAKGDTYLFPQAFTFHGTRLYILYARNNAAGATGAWVSVHDARSGAYLSGFYTDATSFGESIVIRVEGAKTFLYTRKAANVLGKYDITALPSDRGTLNATTVYNIDFSSFLIFDRDRWLVQRYAPSETSSRRHEFQLYDPTFANILGELSFDPAHIWPIAADLIPQNVKAQSVVKFRGGFAIQYGSTYYADAAEPNSSVQGIRLFTDTGVPIESGLMGGNDFIKKLRAAGQTVDLIEGEGLCAYKGALYGMWVTSSHTNVGNYGIVITQELVGDIDCSPITSRAMAAGPLARLNGKVAHDANGIRNPITGAKFTSLRQVIEFMQDASLTRYAFYTTDSTLTDIDGTTYNAGTFVEITTGNFYSWMVWVTSASRVRGFWVVGSRGALTQAELPYGRYATGSYTGTGVDGRIIGLNFTPIWGLIVNRSSTGQAPMWMAATSFNLYNSAVASGGGTPILFGGGTLGAGVGPVDLGFRVNAGYGNANGQSYNYVMFG